jgi:hypothetical protein
LILGGITFIVANLSTCGAQASASSSSTSRPGTGSGGSYPLGDLDAVKACNDLHSMVNQWQEGRQASPTLISGLVESATRAAHANPVWYGSIATSSQALAARVRGAHSEPSVLASSSAASALEAACAAAPLSQGYFPNFPISQHEAQQIATNNLQQAMKITGTVNVAAASAASAALAEAARKGVPLQTLSTAFLNAQLPVVTWVGASTEAPYTSTGKRIVGISVQDGHIITAVQPNLGQCNFGLIVTSPSDPIIVTDHLGGPGTYGSNVGFTTAHCGVASAPSSWLPAKPQALSSLVELPRPSNDCRTTRSDNSVSVTCPIQGTNSQAGGNIPGKNPDSPLCQMAHRDSPALREEESDSPRLQSENWSPAYKRFLLSFYKEMSQTSQAVISRGKAVPANVLAAAHESVKNIPVLEQLVRKAKSTAELNTPTQRTEFLSLFSSLLGVLEYVGEQCGSTPGGSLLPGKASITTHGSGSTVAGTNSIGR